MYIVFILNGILILFILFQLVFYIKILNINRKQLKMRIIDLQNKQSNPMFQYQAKEPLLLSSDIYRKFKEQSSYDICHLNDNDWDLLEKEILTNYDKFDKKVGKTTRLNCNEYKISMLIKCKFKPKEMSNIMCQSKENITSIRRRLCAKYIDADSISPQKWDKFINNI